MIEVAFYALALAAQPIIPAQAPAVAAGQPVATNNAVLRTGTEVPVRLLEERGPNLGFPHSSGINGSRHSHMRELRTQHEGRPYRTLYAFDPRRSAILLIGGDKTGDERWYDVHVPVADRLYEEHLEQLRKEGLING